MTFHWNEVSASESGTTDWNLKITNTIVNKRHSNNICARKEAIRNDDRDEEPARGKQEKKKTEEPAIVNLPKLIISKLLCVR